MRYFCLIRLTSNLEFRGIIVKPIRIIVYVLSLSISVSAWSQNPANGKGQLISGGRVRTFIYHLPTDQPIDNLPMMIGYHANNQTGSIFQIYTGLDAVADKHNFIVVYPDAMTVNQIVRFNYYADDAPGFGTAGDPDGPNPPDPNAADDIQFTADLIEYFIKNFHINPKRVYATGHSGGATMCYHASVALSNKIAAFAPVASNLWANKTYLNDYFTGNKYNQTPILHIHSAGDPNVPSPIPNYPKPAADVYPLSTFAKLNGNPTGSYTTTVLNDYVDSLTFCGMGKKVVLLMTKDATHAWSSQFNTAQVLWNFVKDFQLGPIDKGSAGGSNQLAIAPNPTTGTAQIHFTLAKQEEATLSIINLLGTAMHQQPVIGTGMEQIERIDLSKIATGLYLIRLQSSQGIQVGQILYAY